MPEIALSLLEQRADVVAVLEYRSAMGGALRGVLHDHGLVHQVCSVEDGAGARAGLGTSDRARNGVLVAGRGALRREPAAAGRTPGDRTALERVVHVTLCDGTLVTAAHVPDAGTRAAAGWSEVAAAAARASGGGAGAAGGVPHVVIGDFNAWREGRDSESGRARRHVGLGRLAALGYVDAWRLVHPGARAVSWRGNALFSAGRIDAVWVSPALAGRVRTAWYGVAGEGGGGESAGFFGGFGPSDHVPVGVELAPAG